MFRTLFAVTLASFSCAGPSLSQPANPLEFCGQSDEASVYALKEKISGSWFVEHQAGVLQIAGTELPFPSSGTEMFLIDPNDDRKIEAIFKTNEFGHVLELVPTDESPLDLLHRIESFNPPVSDDAIYEQAGCNAEDLPKLFGQFEMMIPGAEMLMSIEVRLIVFGRDAMYGILYGIGGVDGAPFQSLRTVIMAR